MFRTRQKLLVIVITHPSRLNLNIISIRKHCRKQKTKKTPKSKDKRLPRKDVCNTYVKGLITLIHKAYGQIRRKTAVQ